MVETLPNLIEELRASHALEPAQLDTVERELLPRCSEARGLCKTLISRGWLTTLQAQYLLHGKGKDLYLDPYVLLDQLGEGGMGQVFKARHAKLGRIVALKLIRKEELKDNRVVARFRREIATIAQLSHPNIVTAYDADRVGDRYFYTMEYVDGPDLTRLVREKGPLSVRRACDYIRQAALALAHAHDLSMVHRDVKPSNLLVTADGSTVKLLDLGLARMREGAVYDESLANVTQIGMFVGTPDFVAPEQAVNSRDVDIRADIYGLGCTFYFLLTGEPPFPGESTMDKLIKHRTEEAIRVETVRPDVPRAVAAIQRKLMAKKPEERYQTPEEVVTALEPFCGLGAQARRASPAPMRRPKRIPPIAPLALPPTIEEKTSGPTPRSETVSSGAAGCQPAEAKRQVGDLSHTGLAFSAPTRRRKRGEHTRWILVGAATLGLFGVMLLVLANLVGSGTTAPPPPEEKKPAPVSKSETKRPAAANGWLDQLDPAKLPEDVREAWQAVGSEPPPELVAVFGAHRWRQWGSVRSLAIDPTDSLVASAGDDGGIRIWRLETGKPLVRITGHAGVVRAVAFSHDGKLLASAGDDGSVRLWNTATWETANSFEGHTGAVRCVAFPPSHSAMVVSGGEDGTVRAWNLADGQAVATLDAKAGLVGAVAFSANGRQIAAGTEQGRLKVWEIESRKETLSVETRSKSQITGVAFGPGDKTVVTADVNGKVFLWIAERMQARALPGGDGPVHCLAPLPFGRRQELGFVTGGADGDLHVVRPERKVVAPLIPTFATSRLKGHATGVTAVAVGHRQPVVVSGDLGGVIRVWNLEDGQEKFKVAGSQGPIRAVAFGPEGRTLAAAGGDRLARLWDFGGRNELEFHGHAEGLTGIVLNQQLVTASDDRTLRLWDSASGREKKTLRGHEDHVLCVAGSAPPLSPPSQGGAGGVLASGDAGGVIRLWDAVTGKELAKLVKHGDKVTALAFAPDGKLLLSGSWNGEIVLWDVPRREARVSLRTSSYEVLSLAFAPDGKTFASAGADKTIHFWDTFAGKPFNNLELDASVLAVRYAPDGKRVSFSTADGLVVVSDLTGRRSAEWRLFGPVFDVAFAPDGRHLATANANGTVYVFRVLSLASGARRNDP